MEPGSAAEWVSAGAAWVGALGTIFVLGLGLREYKRSAKVVEREDHRAREEWASRITARIIEPIQYFDAGDVVGADNYSVDPRFDPVRVAPHPPSRSLNVSPAEWRTLRPVGFARVEVRNDNRTAAPLVAVSLQDSTASPLRHTPAGAFEILDGGLPPAESRVVELFFDAEESDSWEHYVTRLEYSDAENTKWRREGDDPPRPFVGNF